MKRIATVFLASTFLFSSCATQSVTTTSRVVPPKTYTAEPKLSARVRDLEWIMNQRNFDYFYPIDRGQCDAQGHPVVFSKLIPDRGQTVSCTYKTEGALKRVGGSVNFMFSLEAEKGFEFLMPAEGCDVSRGLAVSFLFTSDVLSSYDLALKISDGTKEETVTKSDEVTVEGAWKRVYFRLENFHGINLNTIKSVSLIVRAREAVSGTMTIDDVFVIGEKYFVKKSKEDNISLFSLEGTSFDVEKIRALDDDALLTFIAQKTWDYFANTVDAHTKLPVDRVDLEGAKRVNAFTSTTNIGMYVAACLAAEKLGFITTTEMHTRIKEMISVLESLERWNTLFYNYYSTATLEPTTEFVSSVDNGWLAIGLATAEMAVSDEGLRARIKAIVDSMDFSRFYNAGLGHLNLGFDAKTGEPSPYDYGMLCTEARATSYFAIGKGDIEPVHWFKMHRAMPVEWEWQNGTPQGEKRYYMGEHVFEGYYVYKGMMIVPSWGGSMFEFLMPSLFIDERGMATKGLGLNNARAVRAHMAHAQDQGMALWGMSPSANPSKQGGSYAEFGVPPIAAKGYSDDPVVTPHATFLALPYAPKDALTNIRTMLSEYPELFWEYGFFDAIDLRDGTIAKAYLCLDQGMILLSLCNYLADDYIITSFHKHPYAKKSKRFLLMEEFY